MGCGASKTISELKQEIETERVKIQECQGKIKVLQGQIEVSKAEEKMETLG